MKNPFKGVSEETENNNTTENKENNEVVEDITADEEKATNETIETDDKIEESNPLQEKYDALNNQYIRLAADFDNYRKRQEQEKEALLKYGAESTLKKMIEVLDNFERGLKAIETVNDCEKVKECYNLAYKNFTDVLTKAGL